MFSKIWKKNNWVRSPLIKIVGSAPAYHTIHAVKIRSQFWFCNTVEVSQISELYQSGSSFIMGGNLSFLTDLAWHHHMETIHNFMLFAKHTRLKKTAIAELFKMFYFISIIKDLSLVKWSSSVQASFRHTMRFFNQWNIFIAAGNYIHSKACMYVHIIYTWYVWFIYTWYGMCALFWTNQKYTRKEHYNGGF